MTLLLEFEKFVNQHLLCFSGPLIAEIENRPTVVGVSKFSVKPCHVHKQKPSGFSKVASHIDWILANSDAGRCQPVKDFKAEQPQEQP